MVTQDQLRILIVESELDKRKYYSLEERKVDHGNRKEKYLERGKTKLNSFVVYMLQEVDIQPLQLILLT